MSKVFLTGASGYIGGQVLYNLATSQPDLTIRALVRDPAKAREITAALPSVQTIQGTLDDVSIIEKETADADIILNLAIAWHLESVQTIHETLKKRPADKKPAHWIQISGASALAAAEIADQKRVPGSPSDLIFDDLDGAPHLRAFIQGYPSRVVDNYMLAVAADSMPQVNTAIVMPPLIYGEGQGPGNQRSFQVPELARATLQRGRGLRVGKGQSRWGNVHIRDLGELFTLLVQRAVEGGEGPGREEIWNLGGLYLASPGESAFSDMSQRVADAAADGGFISRAAVDEVSGDELPHGVMLYGTNARSTSRRAMALLGWKPQEIGGLGVEIPRAVGAEAAALGLIHVVSDK